MKSTKSASRADTITPSSSVIYHVPMGFIHIEDAICRCQMPIIKQHLAFLGTQSLKSILNLTSYIFPELETYCEENMIDLHNIDYTQMDNSFFSPSLNSEINDNNRSNSSISYSPMKLLDLKVHYVLDTLLLLSLSPRVLVIGSIVDYMDCIVIACIRKLQHWAISAIISEFRMLTNERDYIVLFDLEQYIESFDPKSYCDGRFVDIDGFPEFLATHFRTIVSVLL